MTLEELGKKTKEKYPQYNNIDDRTLGQKVLAKYPQYQSQITGDVTPVSAAPTAATPTVTAPTTTPAKKGLLSSIGSALISSEKAFGETLGQAAGALDKGISADITGANKTYMDTGNKWLEMARKTTDNTKKKKYLDMANQSFADAGSTYKAVLPAIGKTKTQILGEAAGVGLDILTAGTVGKAAAGMKAGKISKVAPTVIKEAIKPTSLLKGAVKGAAGGALVGGAYGATGAAQEGTSIIGGAKSGAIGGAALGGVLGGVGAKISGMPAAKEKKLSTLEEKVDNLVGNITQGDKKQIAKAREALQNIDTKGVKDFKGLKDLAKNDIETIAKKQDEYLSSFKDKIPVEDLSKKIGEREQNFVKQSISQLKKYYDETENLSGFAKVEEFEKRIEKEGVTVQEINNLAREYGSEIGEKAFSKVTGEPLTSINKIASENVRSGLKDVYRSVLPDDTAKELDKHMSNLYTLKSTSEKMEKSVQKLQNKIRERGLMEKLGRAGGKIIRSLPVAGGAARGFFTALLDSNVGNKTMNSLQLEKELSTFLKKADKLNNKIDKMSDKQITDEVGELINMIISSELGQITKRQIIGKTNL
jgi:hypothetical protein